MTRTDWSPVNIKCTIQFPNRATIWSTTRSSKVTSHFKPTSSLQAFLSAHLWTPERWALRFLIQLKGWSAFTTTGDPAEEGPVGRIVRAYRDVFPHGLPDIEVLLAVRVGESLICFRPVDPMGNLMMLLHALPACIVPPTVRTLNRLPLDASRLVSSVACALMPEPCHICCKGTSLHSVPPCASSACGGWAIPSHTQGTL